MNYFFLHIFEFFFFMKKYEALTCKLEAKPIVTMAKGGKTWNVGIKHLTGS